MNKNVFVTDLFILFLLLKRFKSEEKEYLFNERKKKQCKSYICTSLELCKYK